MDAFARDLPIIIFVVKCHYKVSSLASSRKALHRNIEGSGTPAALSILLGRLWRGLVIVFYSDFMLFCFCTVDLNLAVGGPFCSCRFYYNESLNMIGLAAILSPFPGIILERNHEMQ